VVPDDLAQTLRALGKRLLDPTVRADPNATGALLDDEFTEVGRSGTLYRRGDILETLRAAPGFDGSRTIQHFAARPLSEALVLVTYIVPESATVRSSLWRRTAAGWQMACYQGTPLPDTSQDPHL
jgi:hypothetical protein